MTDKYVTVLIQHATDAVTVYSLVDIMFKVLSLQNLRKKSVSAKQGGGGVQHVFLHRMLVRFLL